MSDILFHYSKKRALYFVIFLLLYEISTYISNDMIMPGMLDVVHSFSASDSMVPASLTAFLFGGASLQLFLGPLSDRFGRRPVMVSGALFFLVITILITFATTIHQFIIARYFQGMGLCFISVVGYATLQELFAEKYAVRIISIMSNITIMAPLLGPLLGSFVMEFASWRAIFYVTAIPALVSLIGIWRCMPETINQTKKDKSLHAATPLSLSVLLKNYGSLLKTKEFMLGSVALGFSYSPMVAWIGVSPLILMKGAHMRVLYYGLLQIPVFLMSFIGTLVMRRLLESFSLMRLAEFGTLFVGASFLLMQLALGINSHYIGLIVGLSLYSFGLGLAAGPLSRLVLFSTEVPKGTASALSSLITMIIIGCATQAAGWIYAGYNNIYFGVFCNVCGLIYVALFYVVKTAHPEK